MTTRTRESTAHAALRQEEERLDGVWLVITLVGLAALLAGLSLTVVLLLRSSTRGAIAASVASPPEQSSSVGGLHSELFARPAAGELLKQQQRAELDRYGWVDREHGIVRLPIDVALDVVAREEP